MANTGSFSLPVAVQPTQPPRARVAVAARGMDAETRLAAIAALGMFVLGSGAAAVGLRFEGDGYGGLTFLGGAAIAVGMALPAWMMFRPARAGRR